MSNYDTKSYPYLVAEDQAFAMIFRLTEDEFLQMAGGLKAYTQFRLDRDTARNANVKGQTFDVPGLPSDMKKAMALITMEGVSEAGMASYLLHSQMEQVGGILKGVKATAMFDKQAAEAIRQDALAKEGELERLAAQNPYGWKADSQSAKDWATSQYEERRGKPSPIKGWPPVEQA